MSPNIAPSDSVSPKSSPTITNTTNKSPTTIKNVKKEGGYWNSFYASRKSIIAVPSQFCVLAATEVSPTRPIVEFGCGNGRDSIYLNQQGFRVYATDLSREAIDMNQTKGSVTGLVEEDTNTSISIIDDHQNHDHHTHLSFSVCDSTDEEAVKQIIHKARSSVGGDKLTVYNRFFLHSIDSAQEKLFLLALGRALETGDDLYMEFRSSQDESLPKFYGKDHYRRYVRTEDLIMLLDEVGFDVVYERTGQGMAKFKSEDPYVTRIIAKRR